MLYYLFPNIQLIVNDDSATLIRIYPDENNPGRSITRISFYYSPAAMLQAETEAQAKLNSDDVYNMDQRKNSGPSLASSLKVFRSLVEMEDYVMGEVQ